MKKLLLVLLTFSCAINSLSQQKKVDKTANDAELLSKKQIIVSNFEGQIKTVSFAAVRALARERTATWIWKEEKDLSTRAERLAVTAIDDLYENKVEIPEIYFNNLLPKLYVLLDNNAKETAAKLREKYKITSKDEADFFDALLIQKDGEKLATEAAVRSLLNQTHDESKIRYLLIRLQERQSPELIKLLRAVLDAEETGRIEFTPLTLSHISDYFFASNTSIELRKRFIKRVVAKSKNAAMMAGGDVETYFNLLGKLMPHISGDAPEFLEEATVIHTVLKNRTIQESRESQERNERINNSKDKLAAFIAEAEKTEDKGVKYDLYKSAAHLALKLKKFNYSVDIVEKMEEIDLSSIGIPEWILKNTREQFLKDVVAQALESSEPDSANYAIKRLNNPVSRAESLWKMANFYFERNEVETSRDYLNEAIKSAAKAEVSPQIISSLIKMLPTVHKIDSNQIFELNELAAKSINNIAAPRVEDKPDTENYKNYVASIMIINWNLLPALTKLVKENKAAAEDFANRVNKKEIRIIADFVLMTDSVAQISNQKKVKK
jgi:hypothetical protein